MHHGEGIALTETGARLTAALADGRLRLPEGERVALRPRVGADLSALGACRVVTTDRIEADFWQAAQGFEAADLVLVCLPRARDLARAMIAEAAEKARQLVIIDGAKTDGIDGIWRELRRIGVPVAGLSKAHGRLLWFVPQAMPEGWADPGLRPGPEGFLTQPGIFSADKIDKGSALLAAALPEDLSGAVADLGAGWGYLSRAILTRQGVTTLDLVEAEARALDCARHNAADSRARFHWADATLWQAPGALDHVVMNPPFHTGRSGTPELGLRFIARAAALLRPRGDLWMVANRHLPYEQGLEQHFAQVRELPGSAGFKLFHATRPRKGR